MPSPQKGKKKKKKTGQVKEENERRSPKSEILRTVHARTSSEGTEGRDVLDL